MVHFQSLPLWTTALSCQDLLKTHREDTSNSLCEGLKRSVEQFLTPIINARKIHPISLHHYLCLCEFRMGCQRHPTLLKDQKSTEAESQRYMEHLK